ncbi:MAG: glycoside hydrolase family 3 C-terminal domain-containing protein [Clostridia bacterium]|nr:glycoside hydrolase family 3 C-terminal domain-containing protein [Clostridia bacterium]
MSRYNRMNTFPPLGQTVLTASAEHKHLSRWAAAQGAVLLKNEDNILPLAKGRTVSLFGRACIDYQKGGQGSGEVWSYHITTLFEAFTEKMREGKVNMLTYPGHFYGHKVIYEKVTDEPEIPEFMVNDVVGADGVAIIMIGRTSTEGRDRTAEKGDFYLTDAEKALVDAVCAKTDNVVVVLNVGGMIDTSWITDNPRIKGALLAWQGGIDGCGAIADLLCGDETPSGKLCDTFAREFTDYPSAEHFNDSDDYLKYYEDVYVGYRYFETVPGAAEKVCYPFGFGLSYTTFEMSDVKAEQNGDDITVSVKVTNTGDYAGREVAQVYYSAPQGVLGKPRYELAAFRKTKKLAPGESEVLSMTYPAEQMASYDDLGKLKASAYLLEKGDYKVFVGNSVRNLTDTGFAYEVKEDFRVVEQLSARCRPQNLEQRMLSDGSFEEMPSFPLNRPHDKQPDFTYKPTDKPYTLLDVYEGRCELDDFICQMTDDELIYITGGHEGKSFSDTSGMGGIDRLGIPLSNTSDGPAGVRFRTGLGMCATSWPCATLVACSWDLEVAKTVALGGAREMDENNLNIWLTPAINIHRNPLCGRNFEYLSEDPLLAGKIAAEEVRTMQSLGIACSVKHFACNNKETNRNKSDSIISERALREIYLKAFEIVVKEADPWTIMTSYNKLNGIYTSANYELITGILRGEWGYKGMITTDWVTLAVPEEELIAGNDIKMPNRDNAVIKAALNEGRLTRGDVAVCAKRILKMILKCM